MIFLFVTPKRQEVRFLGSLLTRSRAWLSMGLARGSAPTSGDAQLCVRMRAHRQKHPRESDGQTVRVVAVFETGGNFRNQLAGGFLFCDHKTAGVSIKFSRVALED